MIKNSLGRKLCDPNFNSWQELLSGGLQSCSSRKEGEIESQMLLQEGVSAPSVQGGGAWVSEASDPDAPFEPSEPRENRELTKQRAA